MVLAESFFVYYKSFFSFFVISNLIQFVAIVTENKICFKRRRK